MLLVDTNVLVDILETDPQWADWSITQLRARANLHRLAINPIIYSELSLAFSTVEALDESIDELGLAMIELSPPALFLAGKAVTRYRPAGRAAPRTRCSQTSILAPRQRCFDTHC